MMVAKKKVTDIFKKKSEVAASRLGFQGQLLSLLAHEEKDIGWKSCIYRVPRGVIGLGGPGQHQHTGHTRQPGQVGATC